jgi:3-deoxy-D-manno-octulosonic-acid transferase
VMLMLYSFLMWCAQPLLRRKLALRGVVEPGYLVNIEERFGHYGKSTTQSTPATSQDHQWVWIHAVSLGETRVAAVLIAALRQEIPNMKLLLTHGTATGRAEGQKLLQKGDVQVWQAWDTRAASENFIRYFQPRIGIMMETELWPNMAATCAKFKVPLVLANARMSEKTYLKTKKFAWLARPAYQSITAAWPQSTDDAARFAKLGAKVAGVLGNLKFDAVVDTGQLLKGKSWKLASSRPVVMFASSREGEELQLLHYLQKTNLQKNQTSAAANVNVNVNVNVNANANANVQWLIVPRHPHRFDEVAALIVQQGFKVSKRSAWLDQPDIADSNTIWLGDTLGEMAQYYAMSDVALLGGSFEPLGGQNLIEAAACGCPVVMGPSTYNFTEAAYQAIRAEAAFQRNNLTDALNVVLELVSNSEKLKVAQSSGLKFAAAHQGAARKTAAAVRDLLRQQIVDGG